MARERDAEIFGRNVRTVRNWYGWSMRELAAKAGIGLRTVVRVEQGMGCQPKTEQKLTRLFSMPMGHLWSAEIALHQSQKVVAAAEGRWFFGDVHEGRRYLARRSKVDDEDAAVVSLDPDSIQDEEERHRLGMAGLSRGFSRSLSCNLGAERHIAGMSEIYARDDNPANPGYKYFFHLLRGGLQLSVRGEDFAIEEGGTFFFDAGDPWSAEPLPGTKLPTKLLYVSLVPRKLGESTP